MKGESGSLEFEVTGLKGTRRWLDTHAAPPARRGRPGGRDCSGSRATSRSRNRRRTTCGSRRRQLRALSAHLQTVREDERTGIARELHDELGQSLTALKMDLVAMKSTLASELEEARRAAAEKVAKTVELVDGMVATVRRISSELRPGMLDDLGLFPAIEWLAQDFSQRTGISVRIASEIGSVDLDRTQSTAIFRILQETLTNVARHSNATEVSGLVRESGGAFELEIRDNGKGFPLSILHEASSLGLIGMRERAGSVGGSIEFASKPGDGTTVRLRVPLRAKDPS